MLVVDATVALAAAGIDDGLDYFVDELVAPPLMWSESRSALHEMAWRGEIDPEDAMATRHAPGREPHPPTGTSRTGCQGLGHCQPARVGQDL